MKIAGAPPYEVVFYQAPPPETEAVATAIPEWAPLVERWYQLDAESKALAQGYWRLRDRLARCPDAIVLASPGGSLASDLDFVQSGCLSPAKFVYTLPNVRGSCLLQVMEQTIPLYCIQYGTATVWAGIEQALALGLDEVWVWSIRRSVAGLAAHLFVVRTLRPELRAHAAPRTEEAQPTDLCGYGKTDEELFEWLRSPGELGTFRYGNLGWKWSRP